MKGEHIKKVTEIHLPITMEKCGKKKEKEIKEPIITQWINVVRYFRLYFYNIFIRIIVL
jgi:hypothetical protein